MKKIVLSLAGVLAATAFAPEASAIPSFARQTGMACTACHFQHFPVLNKFGQAFKSSGYTMMGAQSKIEGENLSIPSTLNASMIIKAVYLKNNGVTPPGAISGTTASQGTLGFPDELILFFGGRINDHVGFMFEGNTISSGIGGNLLDGFVMPFVYDVGTGGAKVSFVPFLTSAMGASHGYELGSGGATRGLRFAQQRRDTMAQQFVPIGVGEATGAAFVAENDMGYINFSRWSPSAYAFNGQGATTFKANYLRIAATPTVNDWSMHIGAQFVSGEGYTTGLATVIGGALNTTATVPTPLSLMATKATAVDFQAQTQAGGKDLSLYAAYARAPSVAPVVGGVNGNLYNAGPNARTAFSMAGEYSVIQNALHLGAAYLSGKTGALVNDQTKALTALVKYNLYQNVLLQLDYTHYTGSNVTTTGISNQYALTFQAGW